MMHFEQSTLFADKSRTAHSQNALTARAVLVLTRHRLRFRPFFGNCWCVFFFLFTTMLGLFLFRWLMWLRCPWIRNVDANAAQIYRHVHIRFFSVLYRCQYQAFVNDHNQIWQTSRLFSPLFFAFACDPIEITRYFGKKNTFETCAHALFIYLSFSLPHSR